MKKLILLLLYVAITGTAIVQGDLKKVDRFQGLISLEDSADYSAEDTSDEEDDLSTEDDLTLRGLIISSIAKKTIKELLEQLPCGWPDKGIPPLAPYRNEEVNLSLSKSFVKTITQMLRLRVDGLDNVKIKKFSVSYINKKVKFHFVVRKIQTTSAFNTDTFMDLMKKLGLTVRYEGKGHLDFSLINLTIKGSFKYKLPLIFGSAKIYKWQAVVTLGDCTSNTTGLAPSARVNRYINDKIEDLVLSAINDNQNAISDRIEEAVVPTVNNMLKGNNVWDLIAMMPSGPTEKCIPPPDPWA